MSSTLEQQQQSREQSRASSRRYRQAHPEKHRADCRRWCRANKDRINALNREGRRRRAALAEARREFPGAAAFLLLRSECGFYRAVPVGATERVWRLEREGVKR